MLALAAQLMQIAEVHATPKFQVNHLTLQLRSVSLLERSPARQEYSVKDARRG